MLSVSVHKDIGEYTEKVVGKLSARTLACTAGGLASAVAAAAVANLALGIPSWRPRCRFGSSGSGGRRGFPPRGSCPWWRAMRLATGRSLTPRARARGR